MRALVTGSAGFLGSHLCELLVNEGLEVVAVDNLLTGEAENLAPLRSNPRFEFMRKDAAEPLEIAGPLDYVVHMASPASPPDYLRYPIETMMVSASGTRSALELARLRGARFLLTSTSEVYGDPLVSPQPESYWGNVNPIGPRAVYDEAKRFAESLTMAYHRTHHVDTKIVRIFNTYGPRLRPADGRVVSNFIKQALAGEPLTIYGDGSQTRSFCYVSDLVRGIRLLMDAPFHEPVNIGNPDEYTVAELAHRVIELTHSRSQLEYHPLPIDDPKRRRPDIRRAKEVLGWEPSISLNEGLAATIAWFRERLPG